MSVTYSADVKLPATKIQINEGTQRINVFFKDGYYSAPHFYEEN